MSEGLEKSVVCVKLAPHLQIRPFKVEVEPEVCKKQGFLLDRKQEKQAVSVKPLFGQRNQKSFRNLTSESPQRPVCPSG